MTQKEHSAETEIALFRQNQEFIKSQLEKLVLQVEKVSEAVSGISKISEIQIEIKTQQIDLDTRLIFVEKWQNGIQAQLTLILGGLSIFGVSGIGALLTYFITKK